MTVIGGGLLLIPFMLPLTLELSDDFVMMDFDFIHSICYLRFRITSSI